MASSLLTRSGMIPTTTVVVRSLLPTASSLPSLHLTRPYNKPKFIISCCSSVSETTDLKPVVERWPEYIPNKLPDKNYVRILDTTLRDGEQSPGGSLTPPQKLVIARQLAKLRVDIMEVGFAASSEEEFEIIKTIAKTVGNEIVRSRSEKEFLCKIIGGSIKEGVTTTVNIGDSVGFNMPQEFGEIVTYVKANTPGIDDIVISVHCHNYLGLATANTISGVCAGARQVEVTINGIGERSGNASLEEVVMAMKCRGAYVMDGVYTNIDTRQIMATSKMVQEYTGLYVQPHMPIVGDNCFVHESGIHQWTS